MNTEQITITLPLDDYEMLKDFEQAIQKIKKENAYLVVTHIETKCGFKVYHDIVNSEKINTIVSEQYTKQLELNRNLVTENFELTYNKSSIWQIIKRTLSLS